ALTESAPLYNRPLHRAEAPPEWKSSSAGDAETSLSRVELDAAFMRVIGSPNVACKEWVYRQYDHMVRTNTVVLPGSDAAVIRIKETRRALAMTLDSNARYCYVDPRAGARLVVAEACRNLACSGARPLALTNCLNFGSPERPEVMWQFSETIDGIAEACLALGTPVTGGNVSFYNETEGMGIYPTPVIGMVGLIEEIHQVTTQWFKNEGSLIVLLGETTAGLGASQYLETATGRVLGPVPRLHLDEERALIDALLKMIQGGVVQSAHDCSDGGLAIALAEAGFSSYRRPAIGFSVDLRGSLTAAEILFAESPSRVIVSAAESDAGQILEIAAEYDVPATVIGRTGGDRIAVKIHGDLVIDRPIADVERVWRGTLGRALDIPSLGGSE
ncbi:MAG TPA: AIR synthase related protein, partial [Blastocatellia bacterium]|nr:AIR synthase related protein [Blastocatellia bacterium]